MRVEQDHEVNLKSPLETECKIRQVGFLGDYRPRKCGIATFTTDLLAAVAAEPPQCQCFAVPVNDIEDGYEYPDVVRFEVEEQDLASYVPNLVYSCGSLVHGGQLIIPYGTSDYATTFATLPLNEVFAAKE